MLYSILIYGEDGGYESACEETQQAILAQHRALQAELSKRGPFLSAKLMPTTHAVTLQTPHPDAEPLVIDGPFADTKERFLGLYAAEFENLDEAISFASYISVPGNKLEIRPIGWAGGVLNSD